MLFTRCLLQVSGPTVVGASDSALLNVYSLHADMRTFKANERAWTHYLAMARNGGDVHLRARQKAGIDAATWRQTGRAGEILR